MPLLSALLVLTSWRAPWNRVWTNPTGEYVLAVVREGKIWRKRLTTLGADGTPKTLWAGADEFYPAQAMISDDGHVVLLNEYPGYAHRSAVAVYGDDGKALRRYRVEDLMPKEEFDQLPGDEGLRPKTWIEVAWFDSLRNLVPAGRLPAGGPRSERHDDPQRVPARLPPAYRHGPDARVRPR